MAMPEGKPFWRSQEDIAAARASAVKSLFKLPVDAN